MRYKYQSYAKDGNGAVIASATISVYLASTTTVADVYTAFSGGTAVNSVTSDSEGYFYFWVDDGDYTGEQFFKLVITKSRFSARTLDNIEVLPLLYAGSGTTANRPTVTAVGMYYIDTDIGCPVYWSGSAWQTASLVTDTTPQLGGNLDMNSNNIQGVTPTEMSYVDPTSSIQTQLNTLDSDKVSYTGTAQVPWAKGADVASANALPILTDGNYFDVTGTTSITSIDTTGQVGTVIKLHFDAILIITHHATDLILPGGANITTAAGDEAEFVEYASGDWRCTSFQTATTTPVAGDAVIKAWVSCTGATPPVINDSYNVSSVTRTSAGVFVVNWDTDFADTNYCVVATGEDQLVTYIDTVATGSCEVKTDSVGGTPSDPTNFYVMAIGAQ